MDAVDANCQLCVVNIDCDTSVVITKRDLLPRYVGLTNAFNPNAKDNKVAEKIPGRLNGQTIRQNVRQLFAPRFIAANSRFGSIWSKTLRIFSITNAKLK